jgi:hypothetical protein
MPVPVERLYFTRHTIRAMTDDEIDFDHVRASLQRNDVIEVYLNDMPFPSRLLLGASNGRPLHVVVASDSGGRQVVITAYIVDAMRWDESTGFRRRRLQ